MARDRTNNALQVIFSFFLGLMVLAFIGIGVNTFYPSQDQERQDKIQKLYQKTEYQKDPTTLTPEQQKERDKVQAEIDKLEKENRAASAVWSRNTSIVLILFATAVMATSLIRSDQLRVISNGLLLGGIFTMLYGTGWAVASGESLVRFAVIVFALAMTLGLGYFKFVREKSLAAAPVVEGSVAAGATAGAVDSAGLAALESRIAALEERTAAAGAALGLREGADR